MQTDTAVAEAMETLTRLLFAEVTKLYHAAGRAHAYMEEDRRFAAIGSLLEAEEAKRHTAQLFDAIRTLNRLNPQNNP